MALADRRPGTPQYSDSDATDCSYADVRGGNRTTLTRGGVATSYSYDRADRITTAGTLSTTVNANGNLTNRGADTFNYDQANRLKTASVGGITTTYTYDGDGKLVNETAGGNPTNYVYDVPRSLPVLLTDGTNKYVWGAQGQAYAVDSDQNVQVYHTDGLGSARVLTDGSGTPIQTYQTDVFGVPVASYGSSSQPFGYRGELTDATGLVYLRARMYDPSSGRFLQADPLRKSGQGVNGFNRHAYAGNNPVNGTDRKGLHTYFISGIAPGPGEDPFVQMLRTADVMDVRYFRPYGAEGPLGRAEDAMAVLGHGLAPRLDPDALALKAQVLRDLDPSQGGSPLREGEQLNFIALSGGAQTAWNAADLLDHVVTIDNGVTLGGVTLRGAPGNIVKWTRIIGTNDVIDSAPGIPQANVLVTGVGHTEYRQSSVVQVILDTGVR